MKDKATFKVVYNGETIELTTVAPTAKIATESDLVRAAAWAKASRPLKDSNGKVIREAAPLRAEIEKSILPEHDGIWSKEQDELYREVSLRLLRNEKRLKGGGSSFKSVSEGAATAWSMREDRETLFRLRLIRNSLNDNSAESFADMARLSYLVFACTLRDSKPFYSSLDDYYVKANEIYSGEAATSLLKLMNDVEDVDKSPENDFLYAYGFVDDKYRRINEDGQLIDEQGRLVNEFGQLVDESGTLLDMDGDKLTEDGEFDITFTPFTDEDGNVVEPRTK